MAKQLTDEELKLRRKARRRLIGAVALTLAVVVVLPMVLDSEPRSSSQDIELRIPSPDRSGEFAPVVAVSEVAAAPALATPAVSATPVAASTVAQAIPDDTHAAPVQSTASNTETTGKHPDASKQSSSPGGSGERFAVQIGAYANSDTARKEVDRLKKLGVEAYTEKTGGRVRVRVGPYAEREKAENMRKLLEKHGLHPAVAIVSEHGKQAVSD